MNKAELLHLCSGYSYFERAFLLQLSGERGAVLDQNIKRWIADGTLVPLRRGMYTLAEHLRKTDICLPGLSNDLYPPSYLSGAWALSFHGLIPDVAREYTGATRRRPQSFRNPLGLFTYRHIDEKYFWGHQAYHVAEGAFRCATPEKALIDYWYWARGEWTVDRLRELRLQHHEQLDARKLEAAVRRMNKPRIAGAYRQLIALMREEAS